MTASADSPAPHAGEAPRPIDDAPAFKALQAALYGALSVQGPDLVTRWATQSQEILLFDTSHADRDGLLRDSDAAHDLAKVLLAGFGVDDDEVQPDISVGLRFGAEAFTRGASLHHTAKAVGLLGTMVLSAMEKAVAANDFPRGDVANGIRLARQLQGRAALLSLAVIRGYIQAHAESVRDRFKNLRHDLRNPLGTIKSVLALMDDESIPVEARANPNFRAIAKRNTQSLEAMIADRLGDAAVPLSPTGGQVFSLQPIVTAARRELGTEAQRRGVAVVIEPTELRGRFDVTGLELLLRETLHAALEESRAGEQLRLEVEPSNDGRVEICLSHDLTHAPIQKPAARDRLITLARMLGASLTLSDHVVISVPIRIDERDTNVLSDHPALEEPVGLSVLETSHNLRSTREDDHGQASLL